MIDDKRLKKIDKLSTGIYDIIVTRLFRNPNPRIKLFKAIWVGRTIVANRFSMRNLKSFSGKSEIISSDQICVAQDTFAFSQALDVSAAKNITTNIEMLSQDANGQ